MIEYLNDGVVPVYMVITFFAMPLLNALYELNIFINSRAEVGAPKDGVINLLAMWLIAVLLVELGPLLDYGGQMVDAFVWTSALLWYLYILLSRTPKYIGSTVALVNWDIVARRSMKKQERIETDKEASTTMKLLAYGNGVGLALAVGSLFIPHGVTFTFPLAAMACLFVVDLVTERTKDNLTSGEHAVVEAGLLGGFSPLDTDTVNWVSGIHSQGD